MINNQPIPKWYLHLHLHHLLGRVHWTIKPRTSGTVPRCDDYFWQWHTVVSDQDEPILFSNSSLWCSLTCTWYTWPTAVHAFQTTEQLRYLAQGYKVARCCWPLTSRGLEPGTLGFRVQCCDRSTTRPSFFNTRTGNSPCKLTPGSLLFSGAGFLIFKHF